MTLAVRRAEADDADALLGLIQQHAAFERGTAFITMAELTRLLRADRPAVWLFVAQSRKALTGYAALTFDHALWHGKRFAHLDCLFVQEAARGSGVGKRLLAHCVLASRDAGLDRLEWQTPDWNHNAIRFYEREGGIGQHKVRFSLSLHRDAASAARMGD